MRDAVLVIEKEDYTVRFSNNKAKKMFGVEYMGIKGWITN